MIKILIVASSWYLSSFSYVMLGHTYEIQQIRHSFIYTLNFYETTARIVSGFTLALRHIKLNRTPLDEGSASRRDLYLTTQNTHKRQETLNPSGIRNTIPASERLQNHTLESAATRIGSLN